MTDEAPPPKVFTYTSAVQQGKPQQVPDPTYCDDACRARICAPNPQLCNDDEYDYYGK